jgi:hypothetical protein
MMENMTFILRVGFLGGNGSGIGAISGQFTGDVTKVVSTR